MIVAREKDALRIKLEGDTVKNVFKKVLVSPREGWEGYVMRVFDLEADGYTPKHTHAWPHINYIVRGKGILHLDGVDHEVEAGSYAYVPGNALHQFSNRGEELFSMICIVPEEGDK
ncbi:cupin domain-containing protein [Desulfosporosinus sp. SB140]|uniref:cupin domain-containing protein n=1 Tax=Desulfosporosinus paludis TaxID=3115649 RepID=UPI0038909F9B